MAGRKEKLYLNLNLFIQNGITGIMKTLRRYYLNNKKGLSFIAGTLPEMKKSAALRERHEREGIHIPPFLIASIASQCNLYCMGCYARAGGGCGGGDKAPDLTTAQWRGIFEEASGLGVSFILLAGGEPMMRRDVIEAASRVEKMVFPIFTNGTMLDGEALALFDNHRNLIPVFSLEGDGEYTDSRRGEGVFAAVEGAMASLREKRALFGVSVTVTNENISRVLNADYVAGLRQKGCGILFFVEYVPTEKGTEHLALSSSDIDRLLVVSDELKKAFDDIVILAFPGDEEAMGGCLASGRGFFHINPKGGAEPCPFSPHAKYNLTQTSMLEVLRSDYFEALRGIAAGAGPHTGGCVLFQREDEVLAQLAR